MRQRSALILNNNGIGNALVTLPFLAAIEHGGAINRYYHIDSVALSDEYLLRHAGIKALKGLVPQLWRRFSAESVQQMTEFCHDQEIGLILNLRVEDPRLDEPYFAAKRRLADSGLRCVDLYDSDETLGKAASIYERMDSALRRAGLLRSTVQAVWLPRRLSPSPALGFYLGVSQAIKRWPSQQWQMLIELAAQIHSGPLTLFSGHDAQEQAYAAATFQALPPALRARARLVRPASVGAVCEELAALAALVSHDTFAIHAACAMDLPCVSLFLASDSKSWGPRPDARAAVVAAAPQLRDCPQLKANGTCTHYYTSPESCICRRGLDVETAFGHLSTLLASERRPLARASN